MKFFIFSINKKWQYVLIAVFDDNQNFLPVDPKIYVKQNRGVHTYEPTFSGFSNSLGVVSSKKEPISDFWTDYSILPYKFISREGKIGCLEG